MPVAPGSDFVIMCVYIRMALIPPTDALLLPPRSTQVACMDFAHCKGDFNGVIGTISTKNSNNNIVHLATCIIAKETANAYQYLIRNALKNPRVASFLNKRTTTIITDKHRGSDSAVPATLPHAEHLRCAEHMLKNNGTVRPVR